MSKEDIQDKEYEFPYHYQYHYNEDKIDIVNKYSYGFEHFSLIYVIKRILFKLKPKMILDIGCGDGRLINEIMKEKIIENNLELVTGIDKNQKALAFARNFNNNIKVQFIYEEDFNYKSNFYDIIVLMEVLEHIPLKKIDNFITLLSSLLSIDKHLVISVPSNKNPLQTKHYKHYDLLTLKSIFSKDFIIEEVFFIGSVRIRYKVFKYFYMLFDFFQVEKIKKIMFLIFKRKLMLSSEKECLHILLLCKRKNKS